MIGAVVGRPGLMLWRTAKAVRRRGVSWRAVLVQLNEIGTASSALVASGLAFFGAVMVTIAYAQARKYTGNITIIGPAYFQLLVRELAPLTGVLLLASAVLVVRVAGTVADGGWTHQYTRTAIPVEALFVIALPAARVLG